MHHRNVSDQFITDARDRLPDPGADPVDHLRHTLAAYPSEPDGDMAIQATHGIYEDGPTGLTWGDLREILRPAGAVAARPSERRGKGRTMRVIVTLKVEVDVNARAQLYGITAAEAMIQTLKNLREPDCYLQGMEWHGLVEVDEIDAIVDIDKQPLWPVQELLVGQGVKMTIERTGAGYVYLTDEPSGPRIGITRESDDLYLVVLYRDAEVVAASLPLMRLELVPSGVQILMSATD